MLRRIGFDYMLGRRFARENRTWVMRLSAVNGRLFTCQRAPEIAHWWRGHIRLSIGIGKWCVKGIGGERLADCEARRRCGRGSGWRHEVVGGLGFS